MDVCGRSAPSAAAGRNMRHNDPRTEMLGRRVYFGLVVVVLTACGRRGSGKIDPAELVDAGPPTSEQLAQLRAEMLAESRPYLNRPEYVLTEVVDTCLAKGLQKATNGNYPKPSERAAVIR